MKNTFNSVGRLLATCLILAGCTSDKTTEDIHSPEHSLKDLKVYEGLEVTLFASEPMLTNPTNIDIDARGRVWVCEAYNYRTTLNLGNPVKDEGDRILILEDTDGDGKADKQKVFYQGPEINSALGVCVLGERVIVSCSPNVIMFTDINGDDVPDKKEILFQGIQGEQHDHGVHSFSFGHDGRLYFSMGNEGKTLVDSKGDTVVDIHGRKVVPDRKPFQEGLVLRTDPDGGNVEVVAHNFRNNYESVLDPFGNIWQSDNDDDGNKGTRINYVMEFGNYGFKDEITGAGWRVRRTNWESEIPFRHWHLNDPGVVPNLLQTGSGSPSGMTLYEGDLLPAAFHRQMIHAEPGHNVVRAYPVEKDGAGYKASILNLLEGQRDQWFRPIDVSVAPDGSLFVADWYDPGVGGHQVGDLERGRIYRIAPKDKAYEITQPEVDNAAGAVAALQSPNAATRYLAYESLRRMGASAENELKSLWLGDNSRVRAQALWLLAVLDNGDDYISAALQDDDSDIRVAGIRVARREEKDLIALLAPLARDSSPQVRREVAIALRWDSSTEAAALWATLAAQYDGQDRWYLEALGIGAEGKQDQCFTAWYSNLSEEQKQTPAFADIVWRSRSQHAMPILANLIRSSDEAEMLRYYRAFDFHDGDAKQKILAQLAVQSDGERAMYALKHLDASRVTITPALRGKLNEVLAGYENTIEFVEMINAFDLRQKAPELLQLGLQFPDSLKGTEALKTLTAWERIDLYEDVLAEDSLEQKLSLVHALRPQMNDPEIVGLMKETAIDTSGNIALRKAALRNFSGSWEAEDLLLRMAKEKSIPDDLMETAASVFQNAWRGDLRQEAAQYVSLPANKDGGSLPDIAILTKQSGDAVRGKEIFASLCSNCHLVNGVGTDFGPALGEIGSKLSRSAMYKAILFPDQGISFGFEGYIFKLKDGKDVFGMVTSETEDEIAVKYLQDVQLLRRDQVVSRTPLGNSLMPSNLHSSMTEQELVDLVEYLMTLKGSEGS